MNKIGEEHSLECPFGTVAKDEARTTTTKNMANGSK
jgi:hypothetical protein